MRKKNTVDDGKKEKIAPVKEERRQAKSEGGQ